MVVTAQSGPPSTSKAQPTWDAGLASGARSAAAHGLGAQLLALTASKLRPKQPISDVVWSSLGA